MNFMRTGGQEDETLRGCKLQGRDIGVVVNIRVVTSSKESELQGRDIVVAMNFVRT